LEIIDFVEDRFEAHRYQFLRWAFAGAAVPIFVCTLVGLITATIFYFLSGLSTKHGKTLPVQTMN
jgi:hypothetical protein